MKFTSTQKKLLLKYSANTHVNNEWFIDSGFIAVVPEAWDLEQLPYERQLKKEPLPLKDYFNLFIISFEFFLSLKGPANSTKRDHYTSIFGGYFGALQVYKKYSDEIEDKVRQKKKKKFSLVKVDYDFGKLFATMLEIYRKKCSVNTKTIRR